MAACYKQATRRAGLWIAAGLTLAAFAVSPASADPLKIVALGTSLTAGYGLEQGEGFVPRLEQALQESGLDVVVENAGVSGDTSAGGLARLDWSLNEDVDAVIVELGSNDALRGQNPADTRANLKAILEKLKAKNLPVLLAGMLAPPNLGEDYGAEFAAIYPELAEEYDAVFYPFFLEGVAADPALNQGDGIHPNAAGVKVIVEGIAPYARQLVARAEAGQPS